MRFLKLIVFSMIIFLGAGSAADAGKQSPQPLVVLMEANPWLMVIGSDSPSFVLYDTGLVVFIKKTGKDRYGYFSVQLNPSETHTLFQTLVPKDEFFLLKENYQLSDWTDQITNRFWIRNGKTYKKVEAYGNLQREKEVRAKAPAELLKLYDSIKAYDSPTAKPWKPEKMELMFWGYDYAPDESLVWPEGWPDLKSPDTVKRKSGYSVFFPSSRFQELTALLQKRKPRGAVLINGKKMTVSIRTPFPNEKIWMRK
jgi:hypothetical protein